MPEPIFNNGDIVQLISRPDRVGTIRGNPSLNAGEYWYPIFFGPGRSGRYPESDLELAQIITDVRDLFRDGRFASKDALTKLYAHLRLVTSIRSQIYSMGSSRTDFYAYQFKPLLKFLDSHNHRLLIADEVGLGKTIETGLILREFKKRKDLKRILIIPPAHLVSKWQLEMRGRFDLDFDVIDRNRALEFLRRYEDEGDETIVKGILSLQTLRSRAFIEQWDAISPNLDIVIFDEAGRLRNAGTLSNKVASLLIENSDAALLLTATPVQTSDEDLFNLLRLLDSQEFDSYELFKMRLNANEPILKALRYLQTSSNNMVACYESLKRVEQTMLKRRFIDNPIYNDLIERLQSIQEPTLTELIEIQRDINSLNVFAHIISRTKKRDVHENRPIRKASVVSVEPNGNEQEFYRLITEISKKEYRSSQNNNMVTSFVAITRQRQVASCMAAMLDYYLENIFEDIESSDLNLEDYDINSDNVGGTRPCDIELINNSMASWRSRLRGKDSKFEKFYELIKNLDKEEPGRKIIVFSYYKKTLAYLKNKLHDANILCEVISGDVPSDPINPENDERGKRISNFKNNPKVQILLSTEVGSEGIDLQFAHILINYDLPWNPMVVEQRIGRLDRIGQKSERILIYNLSMKGTIEDKILDRLYNRIGIFEKSIGDLEAILGEEIKQLTNDLFSGHLSAKEQDERIAQTAEVIKRKQEDLERFEEAASALIGHDEFFMDEINRVKNYNRFISGNELILYVRDFLKEHYRPCQLVETETTGLYMLTVSEDLRLFVRSKIPSDDLGLRLFLNRSARGNIKITIDSKFAQDDRKIDFLTFHHPLVRSITSYYNEHADELHPVSHIRLNSNSFTEGIYAWFMYLMEITGARPVKDIHVVIVPITDLTPMNEDASEKMFNEIVLNGSMVPPGERGLSNFPSDNIISVAEDTFLQRLNRRLEQLKRANEALVSKRLSSLEESFSRNIDKRESLLERARAQGKQQSYIRGLETGIKNLRLRYEDNRGEIESSRNIGKSYDLKGAGLVEISNV